MISDSLVKLLNDQIANEYAAHQQYVAIAIYYQKEALPRLAGFSYRQARDERNHAMFIAQYLIDLDARVETPGIAAPRTDFTDIVDPIRLSYNLEVENGKQLDRLAKAAHESDDHKSFWFVQWFMKEKIDEIARMSNLLKVVERSQATPLSIEDYVAREGLECEGESTLKPKAAGGEV